jgi:hypothetical protein
MMKIVTIRAEILVHNSGFMLASIFGIKPSRMMKNANETSTVFLRQHPPKRAQSWSQKLLEFLTELRSRKVSKMKRGFCEFSDCGTADTAKLRKFFGKTKVFLRIFRVNFVTSLNGCGASAFHLNGVLHEQSMQLIIYRKPLPFFISWSCYTNGMSSSQNV